LARAPQPGEPRFDFVDSLSQPLSSFSSSTQRENRPDSLRLVYSYVALYGDPLLSPKLDPYPDGLLQRLSAVGINGVWLHVLLRDLAPGGKTFPSLVLATRSAYRTSGLWWTAPGNSASGLSLYQRTTAMPAAFFKNRPELAGVREGESTPFARRSRGPPMDGRCASARVS